MGDDALPADKNGWVSTMWIDTASLRTYRKHLANGHALLLPRQGDTVRSVQGGSPSPKTTPLGMILHVDVNPPSQYNWYADRIATEGKVSISRTDLPCDKLPSRRWIMKHPMGLGRSEIPAAPREQMREPGMIEEMTDEQADSAAYISNDWKPLSYFG